MGVCVCSGALLRHDHHHPGRLVILPPLSILAQGYTGRDRAALSEQAFWTIWDRLGASGTVLERLGAYGSVWERLEPSGSVLERLEASGRAWKRLGTSRSVWKRFAVKRL